MIRRFLKDQSGVSAVEYGLIVALLSLAIVSGIGGTTNAISNMFTATANYLDSSVD